MYRKSFPWLKHLNTIALVTIVTFFLLPLFFMLLVAFKTTEEVAKDSDRDFWMSAEDAKAYGLVDEVLLINPRKQKKD